MRRIDIFAISFDNFRRRKLRSVLTVLGVVIGTASIVVMISLGIAVNESYAEQMKSIGDLTTVTVNARYDSMGKISNPLDDKAVLTMESIEKVKAASPVIMLYGKMLAGKYTNYASICGINTEVLENLGFKAEQGRLIDAQVQGGNTVYCMFGSDVALNFYDPRNTGGYFYMGTGGEGETPAPLVDPMDDKINFRFTFDYNYGDPNAMPGTNPAKLYNFKNVGVLKKTMGEQDYTIYIDLNTAKKLKKDMLRFQGQPASTIGYDQIKVITNSIADTLKVAQTIKDMGYDAYSNAEWIESMQKQAQSLQLLLGGIGSVALLVAAIGITNTMIMSIYERTRDIGVMKVIGCVLKDIRDMFLCEAAIIGLFGGAIGIVFSYVISAVLNTVSQNGFIGMVGGTKLSVIPPWLSLMALLFAIFVGVVSGFFPARRAMRLSALEAMRN